MLTRTIGVCLLVVAVALGIYAGKDFLLKPMDAWSTSSPAKRISLMIEDDFKNLAQEKELPQEWKSVSKTTYKFESSLTKTLMGNERPHLKTSKPFNDASEKKTETPNNSQQKTAANKQKEYELEIEVLDVPDEENPGFILQMSLLESESKNKIFELGRTYHWSTLNLKNLDEKKPD